MTRHPSYTDCRNAYPILLRMRLERRRTFSVSSLRFIASNRLDRVVSYGIPTTFQTIPFILSSCRRTPPPSIPLIADPAEGGILSKNILHFGAGARFGVASPVTACPNAFWALSAGVEKTILQPTSSLANTFSQMLPRVFGSRSGRLLSPIS